MTSFGEKWRNRKAANEKYLQVVPVVAKSIQLKSKEVWLSVEAFSRPLLNFLFCFRSQKRKKKYLCALKSTQTFQRFIGIFFENIHKKILSSDVQIQDVLYFAVQRFTTTVFWGT